MFSSFPDRTFIFALAALVMSIAALAYLTLTPAIEIETTLDGAPFSTERVSIPEAYGTWGVILALIPPIIILGAILAVPPSGRAERRHKINTIVGTIILWIFVAMFLNQIGLLYVPAATMLTSVVVLMLVRDRTWGKNDIETAQSPSAQTKPKTRRQIETETRIRRQRSRNRVGRPPKRRTPSRTEQR